MVAAQEANLIAAWLGVEVTRVYEPQDLTESMSAGDSCCGTGGTDAAETWDLSAYSRFAASGGRLVVGSVGTDKKCVFIRAIDEGSGIPELDAILAGRKVSRNGRGLGLIGTKRLADGFRIHTGPTGTWIEVEGLELYAETVEPPCREGICRLAVYGDDRDGPGPHQALIEGMEAAAPTIIRNA